MELTTVCTSNSIIFKNHLNTNFQCRYPVKIRIKFPLPIPFLYLFKFPTIRIYKRLNLETVSFLKIIRNVEMNFNNISYEATIPLFSKNIINESRCWSLKLKYYYYLWKQIYRIFHLSLRKWQKNSIKHRKLDCTRVGWYNRLQTFFFLSDEVPSVMQSLKSFPRLNKMAAHKSRGSAISVSWVSISRRL